MLFVHDCEKSDMGQYTVIVENKLSRDSLSYNIIVTGLSEKYHKLRQGMGVGVSCCKAEALSHWIPFHVFTFSGSPGVIYI